MRYLHTMLRVRDLDAALDFYCNKLGLKETRRRVDDKNRYTLVFLAGPEDEKLVEASKKAGRPGPEVELTYNWDTEDYGEARYFGHLAYEVDDIYATCDRLMKAGVTINRPPRDGVMAFVRSPDKHSIELLQKGAAKPPRNHGNQCQIPESGRPRSLAAANEGHYTPETIYICALSRRPTGTHLAWSARVRPSSRGLGHRPFTAVTGVRIP